jgi:7-keto-8-aminopelargonate synthetase-like enzyme
MDRFSRWSARLEAIASLGQGRRLQSVDPTGPTTALVDGKPVIVACSNDYLGLAHHPDVIAAAQGRGAGASRLIGGTRPAHEALEQAIEAWFGRPALLFPSGYQANLAVFSTVCGPGDRIASDALNHASIIDGVRLSRAERTIAAHADPAAIPPDTRLIAVEGLYSMDGDMPPLARYPRDPWLAVDEAHAIGCLGPLGRGAAAAQGLTPDILIGTLGKALGSSGAFVVGPPELKSLLINSARSFIFTTAPPEPVAQMALAATRLATRDDALREALSARVQRFRQSLCQLGWKPLGAAHVVPVVVGPRVMEVAARLLQNGVLAPGIRFPTVPRGLERIRFTVSAAHTDEQLDRVALALGLAPSV